MLSNLEPHSVLPHTGGGSLSLLPVVAIIAILLCLQGALRMIELHRIKLSDLRKFLVEMNNVKLSQINIVKVTLRLNSMNTELHV